MRGIVNILVLFILLAGIVVGLYLIKTIQIFKSSANLNTSKIEFIGPHVSGDTATDTHVRLKITFIAPGSTPAPTSTTHASSSPTASPQHTASPTSTPAPTASSSFKLGVNIPSIADFGYGDMYPVDAKSSDIDSYLQQVQSKGGSIIRIFVANREVDASETARRLNILLDKADQHNISVIISLVDFYGGPWDHQSVITVYNNTACPGRNTPTPDISGSTVVTCKGETKTWDQVERELIGANYASAHSPKGMSDYYSIRWNQTALLSHDFFAGGYRNVYKNFVQTVVSSNKNHSNIYAWEIGNELKDDSSRDTFLSFMQDMSSYIKNLDPNHKISAGFISAGHPGFTPDSLYPNLPNIDIITVHTYSEDHSGAADIAWANQHNKEGIVEEIGGPGLSSEVNYWKNQGAKAILVWDFSDFMGLPSGVLGISSDYPTDFRVANSRDELDNAPVQAFDSNPKEMDWTLPEGAGIKTVYVQFKIDQQWKDPIFATITLQTPVTSPSPLASFHVLPSASGLKSAAPSASLPTTVLIPSPTSSPSQSSASTPTPASQPSSELPVNAISLLQQRKVEEIKKIAQENPPSETSSPVPSLPTLKNPVTSLVTKIPVLGGIFNIIFQALDFWKRV